MISSQDFERLSAYLDNQLSSKEKAALEARLAREPELKATLDGLYQTVRALRSLPVVKPPRNFTLSARQVGAAGQAQRRFFPMLRLATSMAALALVLVFAGDFIAGHAPALSPAAPAQYTTAEQSGATSEAAPPAVAMGAAPAPTSAPTEAMDEGPTDAAAAGRAAVSNDLSATPPPEVNTPMAAAVLAASPATTDTTAPAPAPAGEQPTVSVSEPAAAAKLAPTEAPATAGEQPTSGVSEPAAAAKLAPTEAPAPLAPTETLAPSAVPTAEADQFSTPASAAAPVEPPAAAPDLPWRAAEIGLIGLTLLLAAITWLLRRR